MNICDAASLAFSQGQCMRRASNPEFVIYVDELIPEDAARSNKKYCFSNGSLVWKAAADDVFADDWETVDDPSPDSELTIQAMKELYGTYEKDALWQRSYWIPALITAINLILLAVSLMRSGWFV